MHRNPVLASTLRGFMRTVTRVPRCPNAVRAFSTHGASIALRTAAHHHHSSSAWGALGALGCLVGFGLAPVLCDENVEVRLLLVGG